MLCFSYAPLHSNHHASYLSKARHLMDQKTPLHRSHRPVPCAGVYFVKDSQIHCRHHCPCAPSHMKPNQCSAVLDWKLEAVSTRIYWFLSFSPAPSFFSAQTLPLRPGIKRLYPSARFAVYDSRRSCSERRTRPVGDSCFHWPCLISV